ncbi:MAG TPA: GDP-L-fucose synthase [Terriglobales bacterium]|jgi:GDP-L-fucose synthase
MNFEKSAINPSAKIYVAGHTGLVGSALVRVLRNSGYHNLVLRSHRELNLANQAAVAQFFSQERPEYVFLAAAKVGGILANDTYPADFIQENLAIQNNVIQRAHRTGARRLLFLGSSCIYPKHCPQPIKEEYLLTGPLESTNRAYAVAKIAGIEMCSAYNRQHGTRFLAVMPTNLYGEGDNYDLETSHVIPALIRKISEARQNDSRRVTIWGTGEPRREFLHSDDLAGACLFLMGLDDDQFSALLHAECGPLINIGCGKDITIRELAETIAKIVEFRGELFFDPTKPDGTPRKLLDCSHLNALGWRPKIQLRDGLQQACRSFQNNFQSLAPSISA